ncbi:MAG: SCP2 sterol-binding domain-containing protein [Deltaproteobacteria bacterium]|nr:SCP2 sterol-binding domain-containing protein [Deltaproteobacteria bacterium]
MDAFFHLLAESLRVARPSAAQHGVIAFHVSGQSDATWTVSLGAKGCRVEKSAPPAADLDVYCDPEQLRRMMTEGFTDRPLRVAGDRQLLDVLTALLRTSSSPLALRAKK